jgi:hypothetical protein
MSSEQIWAAISFDVVINHQHFSMTERRVRVVNIPVSYSVGPEFKSRLGDRLYTQTFFAVFLGPSRRMMR